jgi:hypothetical protein
MQIPFHSSLLEKNEKKKTNAPRCYHEEFMRWENGKYQKGVRVPEHELGGDEVAPVGLNERSALATPCSDKTSLVWEAKLSQKIQP